MYDVEHIVRGQANNHILSAFNSFLFDFIKVLATVIESNCRVLYKNVLYFPIIRRK